MSQAILLLMSFHFFERCVCDLAAQVGRVCGTTIFLVVLFCGRHTCTWRVRTHILLGLGIWCVFVFVDED